MSFDWSRVVIPNGNTPTLKAVERFEQSLGFELPDEYRRFLLAFNGGQVKVEHEFFVPQMPFELGVERFLPMTAPHPFLGIVEARAVQVDYRFCMRQAIEIASDGGTGFYFLVLDGEKRGAIYFVWKEDRLGLSPEDWESWEVRIPDDMVQVAPDFDSLGELILANEDEGYGEG